MFLFTYNHPSFPGPHEKMEAMDRIKGILREANFSGSASAFPFSKEYGAWETDLVRSHIVTLWSTHYSCLWRILSSHSNPQLICIF